VLKPIGFHSRGRTFRRTRDGELIQVVNVQAGAYEIGPPPPKVFAWLRPSLFGTFTINLGVYIPEAFDRLIEGFAGTVHIEHCNIRVRLGRLVSGQEIWWPLGRGLGQTIEELRAAIIEHGVPFLDRNADRDVIVRDHVALDAEGLMSNGRLDAVMILHRRGELIAAKTLLGDYHRELKGAGSRNLGHEAAVSELSRRLGFGELT
jgi:Domain of unknown function (DUF4304)